MSVTSTAVAMTEEIREIILRRITGILHDMYGEEVRDLSFPSVMAMMAFKGDPHLNELRLALERLERGEYGSCICCKGAIDAHVLRENPAAHFCTHCAGVLSTHGHGSAR